MHLLIFLHVFFFKSQYMAPKCRLPFDVEYILSEPVYHTEETV